MSTFGNKSTRIKEFKSPGAYLFKSLTSDRESVTNECGSSNMCFLMTKMLKLASVKEPVTNAGLNLPSVTRKSVGVAIRLGRQVHWSGWETWRTPVTLQLGGQETGLPSVGDQQLRPAVLIPVSALSPVSAWTAMGSHCCAGGIMSRISGEAGH